MHILIRILSYCICYPYIATMRRGEYRRKFRLEVAYSINDCSIHSYGKLISQQHERPLLTTATSTAAVLAVRFARSDGTSSTYSSAFQMTLFLTVLHHRIRLNTSRLLRPKQWNEQEENQRDKESLLKLTIEFATILTFVLLYEY